MLAAVRTRARIGANAPLLSLPGQWLGSVPTAAAFATGAGPRYYRAPQILTASRNESGWAVLDAVPDREPITSSSFNPEAGPITPLTLDISFNAGFPIGQIDTAHHAIDTDWSGTSAANLILSAGSVPANRDFELSWRPKASRAPSAALCRETVKGELCYLPMATPPVAAHAAPAPLRETTFIIDTSGSMNGEPIRQAGQIFLVALVHHLASRLTSPVAVDVTPCRPDGAASGIAGIAHNLPAGWDFGKIFSYDGIRAGVPMIPAGALAIHKLEPVNAHAPMQVERGMPLPNTGTLADLKLLAGIILVLMGFMLKLVFRRIRHHAG